MRSSNEAVSQRRDKILDYISATGRTSTEIVAKEFGVSVMTARRDLLYLMEKRLMTEPEAHRFIQKKSMDAGFKMVSTARLIISNYG